MSLDRWNARQPFSAAHLNQAVDAIKDYLPINGGPNVLVHSNGNGGTSLDVKIHHQFGESIDAVIVGHGDVSQAYWFNPRYMVQAIKHNQVDVSAVTYAKHYPYNGTTGDMATDPSYANRQPWDQVMAWNLSETIWGSHFLHIGDQITIHQIYTTLSSGSNSQRFAWWVFSKSPSDIRSAVVAVTPDSCDNVVVVYDEYQTLSGGPGGTKTTSTITLAENTYIAGSNQLTAGKTIHYHPTSRTTGYIEGWFVMTSVGTCCDVTSYSDTYTETVPAANYLTFNPDDFTLTSGHSVDDSTSCDDIAGVEWVGVDINAPVSNTHTDPECTTAKVLNLDHTTTVNTGDVEMPINFIAAKDADTARCTNNCSTPVAATKISGNAILTCANLLAVLESLSFSINCDGEGHFSLTANCPT